MIQFDCNDRCDRCLAQAYHLARKDGLPAELMFCNHHYYEFSTSLFDAGWEIESDVSESNPDHKRLAAV